MQTLTQLFPCVALSLILTTLTLSLAAAPGTEAAAAPTVDCTPLFLSLADCLPLVSEGSTLDKPEASCCSGLKVVLEANPDCLCVGFRSSAQFGVKLNLSKAYEIPSACHLSDPPPNCELAPSPQVAPPANAPGSAPAPAPASAPAPAPASAPEVGGPPPSIDSGNVVAPASSPDKSGSSPEKSGSAAISTYSLVKAVFGLLVAYFVRM